MAAHFARHSKFQQDIYSQKQLFNQEVTLSSRVQWQVFNDQLIRIFKVKLSWHHCSIFHLIYVILWQCNEWIRNKSVNCTGLVRYICNCIVSLYNLVYQTKLDEKENTNLPESAASKLNNCCVQKLLLGSWTSLSHLICPTSLGKNNLERADF